MTFLTSSPLRRTPPAWVRVTAWLAIVLVSAMLWLAYDADSHSRLHGHAKASRASASVDEGRSGNLPPILAKALALACKDHAGCGHSSPEQESPADECSVGCIIALFTQGGLLWLLFVFFRLTRFAVVRTSFTPVGHSMPRALLARHAPACGPPLS